MKNWSTAICLTNGIQMHYRRTGGDKPTLILLHGLMANGACWTEVAHLLAKEYDIIMPDARGHGKSSVPEYGYFYKDHAGDVIGLIHSLKLTAPVLLGHSMGGMTAALVASLCPNLLSGLVLADPTFLNPEFQFQVYHSDAGDQHRQMLDKSVGELIADGKSRHPDRSADIIRLMAQARVQTSMAAFEVLTPPNPDYKQLVRWINVPSLLVLGEKGVVSAMVAEELQRMNPRFQIKQIPDAGHGLHYDQPEGFAAIVCSFIRSIKT